MPKTSSVYVCQQCGYQSPTFLGRCPECGTWNSLVEQIEIISKNNSLNSRTKITALSEVINLKNLEAQNFERIKTGFEEFDRVLGGGVVNGSIILISGDPGIGKSTLLTQVALNVNKTQKVLYVAGEESAQQIKIRVDRLSKNSDLLVLNEIDVDIINNTLEQQKPSLVIIDSIQTLQTQDLESVAGSVSQVREASHRLQRVAKSLHIPVLLVGHVTKEGTVAGPRTLEHLVDVVVTLEGESTNSFRILRSSKNRFGPTDEVGVFEMVESGLSEVKNPSQVFLEEKVDAPGSAVVATMNGLRPILVEIQALVTKSFLPAPRRTGSGIDNARLQLLVAVLQKRLGLPLYDQDIFVNVTGGLKVWEPAADLAICMAIISSLTDNSIKPKTLVLGEVGLLGELRAVRNLDKRISEGTKLGYKNIISPKTSKSLSDVVKDLGLKKSPANK